MLEFLKRLDGIEIFLFSILGVLAVVLLVLLGMGIYAGIDGCWIATETSAGEVVAKEYVPESHTITYQTTYRMIGKVMVPISHTTPAHWRVRVKLVTGGVGHIDLDEDAKIRVGQQVSARWGKGRLSGETILKSITYTPGE